MNSRRFENVTLRREYKEANDRDELAPYFPQEKQKTSYVPFPLPSGAVHKVIISRHNQFAWQVHHITGGLNACRRHDVISNLVCLSQTAHQWCERYQADGVVLCIHAKTIKGQWDWAVMDSIMQPFSIRGWLETKATLFDWMKPYWDSVLKGT